MNRFSGWKGHPSSPSSRANFTLAPAVRELHQGETIRACASTLGSGKWVNVFLIWTFTKIYSAWRVWSSFRDNLVSRTWDARQAYNHYTAVIAVLLLPLSLETIAWQLKAVLLTLQICCPFYKPAQPVKEKGKKDACLTKHCTPNYSTISLVISCIPG